MQRAGADQKCLVSKSTIAEKNVGNVFFEMTFPEKISARESRRISAIQSRILLLKVVSTEIRDAQPAKVRRP